MKHKWKYIKHLTVKKCITCGITKSNTNLGFGRWVTKYFNTKGEYIGANAPECLKETFTIEEFEI